MREVGFRTWSWCGGVTGGSEKAVGADTGSQKASRSGLMSKGTGVTMGSRPAKLHSSKQDGTGADETPKQRQDLNIRISEQCCSSNKHSGKE